MSASISERRRISGGGVLRGRPPAAPSWAFALTRSKAGHKDERLGAAEDSRAAHCAKLVLKTCVPEPSVRSVDFEMVEDRRVAGGVSRPRSAGRIWASVVRKPPGHRGLRVPREFYVDGGRTGARPG